MYTIEVNKIKYQGREVATINHIVVPEMEALVKKLNLINSLQNLLTGTVNNTTFELSTEVGNNTHLVWSINGEVQFKMLLLDVQSYEDTVAEALGKIVKMYVLTQE